MRHVARNRNDPIFRRLVVRNLRQKLLATKRQKLLRVWWPLSSVLQLVQVFLVKGRFNEGKRARQKLVSCNDNDRDVDQL